MSPIDLLTSPIIRYPLIIAVLVGITAPIVGTYLVQKRLALLGDGLGHVALTGVAAGWLVGSLTTLTPVDALAVPGALIAAIAGALIIEWVRMAGHTSRDTALAILLAGGTSQSLMAYLFGSLATVTGTDLITAIVLAIVVVALGVGLRPLLFAVTSDEEHAQAIGLPVRVVNILIAVMAALTVTLAMRIVGALMVSALMIVPVAAAQSVVRGFARTMNLAIVIGVLCAVSGLLLTVYVDLPPGGVIVLLSIAVYILGLVVSVLMPRRRMHHHNHAERSAA